MLYASINEKTAGSKLLLKHFEIRVNDGEKIGFIGRNGTGKTTLFKILTGIDTDFDGSVEISQNEVVMSTMQEHHGLSGTTVLEYIASRLPRYTKLKHILDTYPESMGSNIRLQTEYADALEEFSTKGYFDIENTISSLLDAYQLERDILERDFPSLSGGQKRLVDLIAIQIGEPTIALLDEPTNHMDYVAKKVFIEWLKSVDCSLIVISHDRDVLRHVDRIVELSDHASHSYPGNYEDYLAQNATKTVGKIQGYETTEKRIQNLREQIQYANVKARSQAGQSTGRSGKNKWVVLKGRLEKELDEILNSHEKPSFWIDHESVDKLAPKVTEKYERYKARNIHLSKNDSDSHGILLELEDVALGYGASPLFEHVSFQLRAGDRMRIIGRNGAGKTTLVRAIMDTIGGSRPATIIGKGIILPARTLRASLYEQEVSENILSRSLYEAIEQIYLDCHIPVNDQLVRQTLSNYLFDPSTDGHIGVAELSGGQKARLQLIRMLAGNPSLLILDEPTNHLDLPSIEELEKHLMTYTGAILYISHDSYFADKLGGKTITI